MTGTEEPQDLKAFFSLSIQGARPPPLRRPLRS